MKKAIGGIAVIIGLIIAPFSLRVRAATNIVISEIQTSSLQSASEEYIQITNQSTAAVDITGWRLEYFSANPKSFSTPSRTIKLSGEVPGGSDYVVSSTGYKTNEANNFFSATLASAGGHLRLVSGDITAPSILDMVGWGSAVKPESTAVSAPQSGEILVRNTDANGRYVDTDNNASDFEDNQPTVRGFLGSYSTEIIISELLPNPASPVSDAVGEYIELHNPSISSVSLRDFTLLSGSTLSHSYVFKDQQLGPGEYKSFFVTETRAALSNTSGKVQLQGPDGVVVDESSSYVSAPEGEAWAWDGMTWQWTSSPTPNAPNSVIVPAEAIPAKALKKSTTKTTKKAAVKKPKAKGNVKAASTNNPAKSAGSSESTPAPMHASVLAGVGGLAVLYGVYEYRQDIATAFRKLRGNRGNRS